YINLNAVNIVEAVVMFEVSDNFFFFSSRRRHTSFDCDWSSDVCSSDLVGHVVADGRGVVGQGGERGPDLALGQDAADGGLDLGQIGRASCRERGYMSVVDVSFTKSYWLNLLLPAL